MTIGATKFSHSEGDPVTYARYNQVRFYMATTLTGTYSVQTTENMDVDNASLETVWDDTDGISTNYYKVSYYNNVTTLESALSDPISGGGLDVESVRYITDMILREADDEKESITKRDEILDWMNDCNADIMARRRKWSWLYTRAASSRVADQETYSLSTNFGVTNAYKIDHFDYNLNDGTQDVTYRLREVPKEEFDYITEDNDADSSDSLQKFCWDEAMDYIRVYPKPATAGTAVFYLYYYKELALLDSDGDTIEIPDSRLYKYYCLQQFYNKKDDKRRSDYYAIKYEQAIANLVRRENKTIGQPRSFPYNPDGLRKYFKY